RGRPRPGRRAPAEQAFEEIAEAPARPATGEYLVEIEAARAGSATEPRRRHLVARAVPPRAQLVVRLAAGRVAQRLVGLVDGLEALLGAGLLAHVRLVLARQAPVGGLDFRVAGVGLHALHVVVILELHALSTTTARVTRAVASLPVEARAGQCAVCTPTWIRRGVVSGRLGITISSMPSRPLATMPSGSALSGSAKRRWKLP